MSVDTSLPALLTTLTQALSSASEFTPDISAVLPPKDGISLLDVKNELLLSYLQNLVFLIILKLRNHSGGSEDEEESQQFDNAVVKKLVELRVYLEKGVRRLEGRLQYQIDKVLRAADDAARANASKSNGAKAAANGAASRDEEGSEGDSEDESDASSDSDSALKAAEIDDLQYRPNPSALMRPFTAPSERDTNRSSDGIYKPPRITATAMPSTERREKFERRPQKSATLDEFISTELSTAPLAEPSIGSTIIDRGRKNKSDKERREEVERKEYEELHYTRLPRESKKERAKKRGRDRVAGYGGEEWRDLGEGVERIVKLTSRKAGDGVRGVLEKSRKRRAAEDGPRGSGAAGIGQGFQKRLKHLNTERSGGGNKNKRKKETGW